MRIGNRLLDSLPKSELDLLRPYLRKTILEKDAILSDSGDDVTGAYFPISGLISCIGSTSAGEQLEIYAAGREDVLGMAALAGNKHALRAKVLIPGEAVLLSINDFVRCFSQMAMFRQILFRYLSDLIVTIGHRVCCVQFHKAPERVCQWLALASDITRKSVLECTQQSIADAIGARRATVTVILGNLRRRGVLYYTRGSIIIKDSTRLRKCACECLEILRAAT